jgi:hypothetical protein
MKNNIKNLAQRQGFKNANQLYLAILAKTDVSAQCVYDWWDGKSSPQKKDLVFALINILECKYDELFLEV